MNDHPTRSHARARWQQAWAARWQALSAREQSLLRVLAVCLVLALGWQLLIAAPLQSLRDSDARRATLAQSQAQMQVWQAQAQAAQQQPRLNTAEAATVLRTLTAAAGQGWQVQVQGERANVQVTDAAPEALAQWLVQAREQAHSLPVQAQLERVDAKAGEVRWRGRLVLALPPTGQP